MYRDINPHKRGPRWPQYVGIAVLACGAMTVVSLALFQ